MLRVVLKGGLLLKAAFQFSTVEIFTSLRGGIIKLVKLLETEVILRLGILKFGGRKLEDLF